MDGVVDEQVDCAVTVGFWLNQLEKYIIMKERGKRETDLSDQKLDITLPQDHPDDLQLAKVPLSVKQADSSVLKTSFQASLLYL